jgi:hypothetical protein
MRRAGWKIFRLEEEMGSHDAAITRFGQWWKRCVRSGHAYAQATSLHGGGIRVNAALVFWSWILPAASLAAAWPTRGLSLLLFLLYPLLTMRIAAGRRRRGAPSRHAWLYAVFCVLAKLPQALGQLRFVFGRRPGQAPALIEYKTVAPKNGTGGGA